MLFKSTKEDKIVSSKNGFIHFKNGIYETVDKDEIEALEKALDVTKEVKTSKQTKEDSKTE